MEVSQATVGRYLPWRPKVPSPTWRSFLHNHLTDIAAINMLVVARIVRSLAAYNRPPQARLLRARRSVVYIIATNVAPRELLWRPNRQTREGRSFYNRIARVQWWLSLHSIRLAYSRETGGRPKVPLEIRQLIRDMSLRYVFLCICRIVGSRRCGCPWCGPGGCHSCRDCQDFRVKAGFVTPT